MVFGSRSLKLTEIKMFLHVFGSRSSKLTKITMYLHVFWSKVIENKKNNIVFLLELN